MAEALSNLGFEVTADDYRIKCALNVFFKAYVDTFELREGAKKLLKQAQQQCKVGLISNFTHAPVIYKSLRQLGHKRRFLMWLWFQRKMAGENQAAKIFQDALNRLRVQAKEAVYIGDSPIEDIKGAKASRVKNSVCPITI